MLALTGGLLLVGVPLWIAGKIYTSGNPVDSAAVFGGYLAAAGIALPLLVELIKWWWNNRAAVGSSASTATQMVAAIERLAENMQQTWRREADARRLRIPAPARVRWQWGSSQVTPPRAELVTAPEAGTGPHPLHSPSSSNFGMLLDDGVVTRLRDEVYTQLPYGRLVLIGGPGAGKTSAMILLLLAVLDSRCPPEAQAADMPVPVWLTLGGWEPATQTLHHWVKTTMYRDHPYLHAAEYGQDVVGDLLRTGRVTLFLDGLDEMAADAQSKALQRIDYEGVGLRVVLSSRRDEYIGAYAKGHLHSTAVIEIQPVDPAAAHNYLLQNQVGSQRASWDEVGNHLEANPASVAACSLNNPLTLSLARDAYEYHDPLELIDSVRFPTVAAFRAHLIERILIIAYPDESQRARDTRWLAWIAHHMGSNRDLGWWEIPTWISKRRRYAAVGTVAGFLAICGFVLGLVAPQDPASTNMLLNGMRGGVGLSLLPTLMFGYFVSHLVKKLRDAMRPRWPRPREIFRILISTCGLGLVAGLMMGFSFGFRQGVTIGAGAGIFFGVAVLPIVFLLNLKRLWEVPFGVVATTPSTEYRHNRRASTVFALGAGLMSGLYVGPLLFGVYNFAAGFVAGILLGLFVSAQFGLRNPAPLVILAQFVLALTRAGRISFARLLDDAHKRQILRQAGAVYQFRHSELQKYLAKFYREGPAGSID